MYFLKDQYKIKIITTLAIIFQALHMGLSVHFSLLIFKITLKVEKTEDEKLGDFKYNTAYNTGVLFLDNVN